MFAGTVEEVDFVRENLSAENTSLRFLRHGDLWAHKIIPVDWKRYYELFPAKYFSIPNVMKHTIENCVSSETLEVGGNARVDTKYALDAFVKAENAENIWWSDVEKMHFDLVAAKKLHQLPDFVRNQNAHRTYKPDGCQYIPFASH